MSDVRDTEKKKSLPADSAESGRENTTAKATASRKTAAPKDDEEQDEKPARARPAPPARPSIYDAITQTAKKAEAERAAKAAALKEKEKISSQTARGLGATTAKPEAKKTVSPFLTAPITRAPTPVVPVETEIAKPAVPSASPAATAAPSEAPTAVLTHPAQVVVETPKVVTPPVPEAAEKPVETTVEPDLIATVEAELKKPSARSEVETGGAIAPKAKPATKTAPAARAKPSSTTESAKMARKHEAKGAPGTMAKPKAHAPAATPKVSTPRQAHSREAVAPAVLPQPRPPHTVRPRRPTAAPVRKPVRPPPKPIEPVAPKVVAPPKPAGPVELPTIISVRDLATLLNAPVGEMLKRLMKRGILATINQALDYDTASLIAEEFEIKTKPAEAPAAKAEAQPVSLRAVVDSGKGELRPPVVTVLGHVDHGKTSLLDAIRNTRVAAGEAGGITQHIGAYQIEKQGRKITFLDTPGHEAFTAMRARGARMTDVAVLVVAADDGVMPQTVEAINHARAAKVPIVVALNKIDRETADPARVIRQLADHEVFVEEWGGDTPIVRVSARKNLGIDELLDMILLVADLDEHKADPHAPAVGSVIEAEVDRSRGPVATLLVQNGTLHQSDYIVIGGVWGRIRAMFDDRGNRLMEAGPSMPVLVLGLPSAPQAGMTFQVVPDERAARELSEKQTVEAEQALKTSKALSLDDLYAQMQAGKVHELNLILKADVNGSLEPISSSLERLSTESLRVRILHHGLGNISESDVSLALASKAIVIGFNVEPDPAAKRLASVESVDVRQYTIIYQLIEDVDKALKGLLEPKYREVVDGHAEVRALFKVSKRMVAGCYVTDGKALRAGQVRVLRAGKPAWDGRVASLKRFTEDVREVATNFECGVLLEGFEDVKPGDILEFYHKEKEE